MGIDNFNVALLYLLGAVHGVFLALTLFTSKAGNRLANRYLGALTLVFAAALIDYYLDASGQRDTYIQLRTLLWPKEFLYGTLLYFYAREITLPDKFQLQGKQWLHFVPTFLHMAVTWPVLLFSAPRQRLILANDADSQVPDAGFAFLLGNFELYTVIFQLTIYFYLCWRLLIQHRQRIKHNFSYTEKISLDWLRLLIAGIFCVYVIWLLEELLSPWLEMERSFDILLAVSMVILIYSMGYLGLRQPLIFSKHKHRQLERSLPGTEFPLAETPIDETLKSSSTTSSHKIDHRSQISMFSVYEPDETKKQISKFSTRAPDKAKQLSGRSSHERDNWSTSQHEKFNSENEAGHPEAEKYKNSPLTADLGEALLQELQDLMATEQPYLDQKLSLPALSAQLGVSVNYLSQTINERAGQNFFDFINSYRISDARQRLANPQQKANVLNIAMAVGFNSKSAFYNAFKKQTGMTPTQYRKSLATEKAHA